MPAKVTKVKGGYRVATPKGVHAKKTTKKKAKAQQRLLNAIDHGWKPTNRVTISDHKTIMGQGKKKKKKKG